jgi:hypothetical protein
MNDMCQREPIVACLPLQATAAQSRSSNRETAPQALIDLSSTSLDEHLIYMAT